MKAGQELFDAKSVSDIVVDGEGVRGKVKGSQMAVHTTSLKRAINQQGQARLDCNCSCPTFTDGWEKICHHGVALGLELRKQFLAGGELTLTQNPWVSDVESQSRNRYQIEQRRGGWHVTVFGTGTSVGAKRSRQGMGTVDKLIQHYIDQEVDESEEGA